ADRHDAIPVSALKLRVKLRKAAGEIEKEIWRLRRERKIFERKVCFHFAVVLQRGPILTQELWNETSRQTNGRAQRFQIRFGQTERLKSVVPENPRSRAGNDFSARTGFLERQGNFSIAFQSSAQR